MPEDKDELARRALAIAAALAAADPGEKAEARRMADQGAPVFWRQAARLDIPRWQEAGWRQFTRLVALMTPASRDRSIHNGELHLGAALALAKFSEERLARLMAARGAARDEALVRAIRMLARKQPEFNVVDLAHIIFRPEDASRLARAYYRHQDNSQKEDAQHD